MSVTKLVPKTQGSGKATGRMCSTEQSRIMSALLEDCAREDRAAFRRLYEISSRYVFGIVLGILRDRDIAAEVAQETFIRVWRRADQFDVNAGNPLSWVGSIARNCAIDRLRSERARGFVKFTDEVPDLASDVDRDDRNLEMFVIRRLLEELRPEYRQALLLSYFQGYTYVELANVMDVPVGTAKCWVRRGLAALRDAMQ